MDLGTALSKISFNIEHLNMKIFDLVSANYETLLNQMYSSF